MNAAREEAESLLRYFEERGIPISLRTLAKVLRLVGLTFDDRELRGLTPQTHRTDTARAPQFSCSNTAPAPREHRTDTATEEKGFPPHPLSQENISTPSLRSGDPPRKRRKSDRDSVVDIAWRTDVLEAARALWRREMRSWTTTERYAWARWHAMTFANCNKQEGRNKVMATKIAAALLNMASSKFGDMTGREYFHLATRVHERRNKAPWYDPWLIKSEMEIAE